VKAFGGWFFCRRNGLLHGKFFYIVILSQPELCPRMSVPFVQTARVELSGLKTSRALAIFELLPEPFFGSKRVT
jgi:hypothetical protein